MLIALAVGTLGAAPAATPAAAPCPFEAMHEENTKTTWYWPRGFDWRPDDVTLFPLLGRHENGKRSVALRVVLRDPPNAARESLQLLIDDEPVTLTFDHGEASGKSTGVCHQIVAFSLPSQQDLVRRIARANSVSIVTGVRTGAGRALSRDDLQGFRNLALLIDASELPDPPPAPPTETDPETRPGWTRPQVVRASKVAPKYPPEARRLKMQAKMVLRAVIRKDGRVDQVEVAAPTGAECGFEGSTIEAVQQWRYSPATCNGDPVDFPLTIVVNFAMAN